MWCHDVCDVAESSSNFNNAHNNDSDDDDDDGDDEENDDISVSEKYLPLGWWGSSSFTPSPGLPGPLLIHKCFHGNRDLGSLIESLYHLGNRAKGGAWLIVFFVVVVFFYSFICFCSCYTRTLRPQTTHMHGCTCDDGALMIYAHANIHHSSQRTDGGSWREWFDRPAAECGSFITANDNIDGPFGKYRQTQCKSGTTCTEAHVINEE